MKQKNTLILKKVEELQEKALKELIQKINECLSTSPDTSKNFTSKNV